jgi:hypothetical protein
VANEEVIAKVTSEVTKALKNGFRECFQEPL